MNDRYDVAVIGAGAAGLMAAIFAARAGARVVAIDGASKIGAKILIAGGGRCNVTHDVVHAADFNGSRNAIAKVLRTFDVPQTIEFFESLGVPLKREEGGKLFPVSDRARDVLDALLRAARDSGVEVVTAVKVSSVSVFRSALESFTVDRSPFAEGGSEDSREESDRATVNGERPTLNNAPRSALRETRTSTVTGERRTANEFLINGSIAARRVILAAGGRSVPRTGSDGSGYDLAHSLGHTITETFPALVPLLVDPSHWIPSLSGTSVEVELAVTSPSGRVLHRQLGSMLFTHFGISGPVVLDISRHWIAARPARLVANFLPGRSFEPVDCELIAEGRRNPHATVAGFLRRLMPERLAAQLAGNASLGRLSKEERRQIVRDVVGMEIPIRGDRGFQYAEVTAGGVPLTEIDLNTMRSRVCEGLYFCGEILDVDGRIGGYNFQWAWASGRLAGVGSVA